jgi:hypothetical protein
MLQRSWTGFLAAVLLVVGPATASARQDMAEMDSERPVGIGGEISIIGGPSDDEAYFNYTDYDKNALRIARARVFGEWRARPSLSFMGELRSEDGTDFSASAAYVRWQPFSHSSLYIQAGRIPPVIGGFARRAYSRDNPVIGEPLAYQYLTAIRPDALPATPADLIRMRARGWQLSYPVGSNERAGGLPIISVSQWDTGVEGDWQRGPIEIAAALTQGSPAEPVVHDRNNGLMWSGRVAATLTGGVVVGVSAARGAWVDNAALEATLQGMGADSSQSLVGVDVEYGRDRWLVRGEWLHSVFEMPFAADTSSTPLPATSAFAELRFRFSPRWQLGGRVDDLSFGDLPTNPGVSWDAPVRRVEATLAYRVTRQFELRGGWQQNWRDGGRVLRRGFPAAGILYWF